MDATGVALNGSAGQAVLASRGLQSFCPVDESGNATTMGAVILISNTNVFDNIAVGATVGTLSVAGGSGTYTFTLPSNPGAHFATAGTNGVNLNTATALTAGSYPVTVQAAGGVPTPISRALSITVTQSPTIPANTALPVISGMTQVGLTLTTTNGTWTGFPAARFHLPMEARRQRDRGATANSYLLVTADVGAMITVTVTATNTAGNAGATSAGVGPVAAAPVAPANTVLPVISGSVNVASVLTASGDTWTGTAPITYTYQWVQNSTNIAGATTNSYTLATADIGAMITVRVTATNSVGNANATSTAVGPVTALPTYTQAAVRNYVAEGDSITAVSGGMLYSAYYALPGFQTKATVAVSGATLADIIGRAATTDGLLVAGALNVLSVLIGANGLADTTAYPSVNDWLTSMASYCDARRAAGWYVLVETILPQGTNPVNTHNTRRAVTNPEMKLWVTNGSIVPGKHADQIFDLGGDPIMGPDNSHTANSTYWSGDGVHPSSLGYDRITAISKVPAGGASAASVTRVLPPSVTRLLWLTPQREATSPYTSLIATAPNCNWTLLGGSDPGFTLTGTLAYPTSTYIGPADTLNHPASSVGTFVANLRGVDCFGNVYTPVLTLTVTAANSTLNVAPNGGRFDTYYPTQLTDRGADGSISYGIEEINGNPALQLTSVIGENYPQADVGTGGPGVSGTIYEYSYRTWRTNVGPSVVVISGEPDAGYYTQPPVTTAMIITQGTYTQAAATGTYDLAFYFNGATIVGEKAWIDDFEIRAVLGPVITKPVFAPSGPSTGRITVTTPGTTGTMYAVVTARANRPTKAQIKAGRDELGATSLFAGSAAVTGAKAYTFNVSGLTAATVYHAHIVHETAAGFSNTLWASATTRALPSTTWSPVNKGATMALSNGNLTIARSATVGYWQTIASVDGIASGTQSFKVTFGGSATGNWEIGVLNTVSNAYDFGDSGGIIGGDSNFTLGWVNNGIYPGGATPAVAAPVIGDTIEFVVDADLKRIRVRNVTQAPGTYSAWYDMSAEPFWNFTSGGASVGISIYAIAGLHEVAVPNLTADFTSWGS